jgi:hypothetical protein
LTDFFLTETRITIHNKVVTKICIALQLLSGIGHALFLNHGVEVLTIHGVVGQFNLFKQVVCQQDYSFIFTVI